MKNVNLPYDRSAEGRLYTVPQVVEMLACSRSWVYQMIGEGKLKAIRIGEKKGLRVTEKSLRAYGV